MYAAFTVVRDSDPWAWPLRYRYRGHGHTSLNFFQASFLQLQKLRTKLWWSSIHLNPYPAVDCIWYFHILITSQLFLSGFLDATWYNQRTPHVLLVNYHQPCSKAFSDYRVTAWGLGPNTIGQRESSLSRWARRMTSHLIFRRGRMVLRLICHLISIALSWSNGKVYGLETTRDWNTNQNTGNKNK